MMTHASDLLAFALGPAEGGIILFIIVLLFGAKRLPQLARSMGKSMGEFKRGKQEFEAELNKGSEEADNADDSASSDTSSDSKSA